MNRSLLFFSGLILLMLSCYPQGPEYTNELDIVYTSYDRDYNFGGSGTYSMPDRIVKITRNLIEGEDPEFVKEPYDMNFSTGFKLGLKYYTGFSGGDLDSQSYLAISAGLIFKL